MFTAAFDVTALDVAVLGVAALSDLGFVEGF